MTQASQLPLSVQTAIETRRAARSFNPDPIADETLAEILRLGLRSPSGFNLQPWRFIVVRDAASKEKLYPCAFNQRQVLEAPVVLICCGDRQVGKLDYINAVIDLGIAEGAMNDQYADFMRSAIPGIFANRMTSESKEIWTNRNVMLAVAHLMIAAKSLGVDSCPMEGFDANKVREAFSIPAEVDVCCLLPLGYAAAEPAKTFGGRFSLDRVCFSESFGQAWSL